jgi:toxin CcdB
MPQFFVYKNLDKNSRNAYPYFVDVQNSLLSDLNTKRLCPVIPINGRDYVLLTHQLTSVPISTLSKEESSIEPSRYEILDAIDMLITGI